MNENRKVTGMVILFLVVVVGLWFWTDIRYSCAESGGGEPLKVTFLKVGKADAIAVQTGNKTMVIDAGEEEDGEELVAFLKNQGISYVDVLVITHFDRDHVGGADTLVEEMEIGEILLPAYEGTHTEYLDFMHALEKKGIQPRRLTEPVEMQLGEAFVKTEPPQSYEMKEGVIEQDNNFSLITTLIHGDNRFLFTGDAEKQRIRQWLSQENVEVCDFLKVPHHGVYNTALKDLADAVSPEYAVICSSGKNPADAKTLELLRSRGIETLETKDGNVTVISDGNHLEIRQELER